MAGSSIRAHAEEQAKSLLRRFREEAKRTARQPDADAVHDLRVSIRRLTQCLRTFSQFLPGRRTRKTRRGLKRLMGLAAEVRNRDITIEFLERAGSPPGPALTRGRARAERNLRAALGKHEL